MERLIEREQKDCAVFQRSLRMIDQQVDRDDACADDSARQRATGPGDNGARDHAGARRSAVFDANFLDARAGRNCAFTADAIVGAGRAGGLSIKMKARSVGQNHKLRLQAHGTVAREVTAGNRINFAVDLGSRGNENLAILHHVGHNARAERIAVLVHGGREPIHQTNANDGALAQGSWRQRSRVNDVAIGIARGHALIQRRRGRIVRRYLHDAVVGAVGLAGLHVLGRNVVGRNGVERAVERALPRLCLCRRLRDHRMAGGGLGDGRSLRLWSGNGVIGRRIRSARVWRRLACLLRSQYGRGGGQNDIDNNGPLHPDLLSRSKDLLTSVRPCGDGKVPRLPPPSRRRRKTTQCKRSATLNNGELVDDRHVPRTARIKIVIFALCRDDSSMCDHRHKGDPQPVC